MAASAAAPGADAGPRGAELDLREPPDRPGRRRTRWPASAAARQSVMSIVETLRRAETDDRVKALFVRLPEGGMEPGRGRRAAPGVQALPRRRQAGDRPQPGALSLGVVTSTYMLGAAADELWMQPGASFQATGLANEDMFFKRVFDKYGVKADYEQRYEYKNAVNPLPLRRLHRRPTASRELSWMGSVYDTALTAAAADRKIDPAALQGRHRGRPLLPPRTPRPRA